MKTRAMAPIGISDFHELLSFEDDMKIGYLFVDKTSFIRELVLHGKVTLITRPRRFGKSLNMSMLHYFLAPQVHRVNTETFFKEYYDELAICKEYPDFVAAHQGKYPVIALSLKRLSGSNYEEMYACVKSLIADEFREHKYLLAAETLDDEEKELFQRFLNKTADQAEYKEAIKYLCQYLERHHEVKPYVLIDEYDAPLIAAFSKGYYSQAIDFLKGFFGNAFKDNVYLNKAILTGITRISQESLFSGMNNLVVSSCLDDKYAGYCGFTETEVTEMLSKVKKDTYFFKVKSWYNGYRFGSQTSIYNPWSIVNYIYKEKLGSHWVNTGANEILFSLMNNASTATLQDLATFLTTPYEEWDLLLCDELNEKKLLEFVRSNDLNDCVVLLNDNKICVIKNQEFYKNNDDEILYYKSTDFDRNDADINHRYNIPLAPSNEILIHDPVSTDEKVLRQQVLDIGLVGSEQSHYKIVNVNEHTIMKELSETGDPGDLWGYILAAGYLTGFKYMYADEQEEKYAIYPPNKETRLVLSDMLKKWLIKKSNIQTNTLDNLATFLVNKQVKEFIEGVEQIFKLYASYHHTARTPENFYQGCMMMLTLPLHSKYMADLEGESGGGRYDLAFTPRQADLPSIIIELKSTNDESKLESEAQSALEQIYDRAYLTRLYRQKHLYKFTQAIVMGISFCKSNICFKHEVIDLPAKLANLKTNKRLASPIQARSSKRQKKTAITPQFTAASSSSQSKAIKRSGPKTQSPSSQKRRKRKD